VPSEQQRDQGDSGSARRGPAPLVCEQFQGINTATTRAGVPDQQMYWCDGFMPLAPRNLRTLHGIGPAVYTAPGGLAVVCFYFYNIGPTPYAVVFLSDGSVVQVGTTDGAVTQILPTGSILNPSISNLGVAQYGSQYLLIVANQPNGYWIWDGSVVYTAGTLAPRVLLTNTGSGYVTAPLVQATGGLGSGATFAATIDSAGHVVSVVITNPGSGYLGTDTPTLTFTGGNQAGSGGNLTAVLSASGPGTSAVLTANTVAVGGKFTIQSVTVNNGGSGYSPVTTVTATGGGVLTAPTLTPVITNGVITSVTVNNGGLFAGGDPNPPLTITDAGCFVVTSVTINNGGAGYGPNCSIAVSAGGSPQSQAVLLPVLSGGVIAEVTISSGGIYGSNTPPTLVVNDSSSTAAGTISVAPFGLSGTAIATYAGHVWIFNGAVFSWSAPGSVTDFATSDGGGTEKSNDSFLKVGYTAAVQTNGFLFLIGDSSMNYISGVQVTTANNVTTTTFTNNNSDPETGTPYPASVTTIGQDILIANQNGVYVSSGGTFQKKSEMLDGIYNSAPGSFNGAQLSAAKDLIFGKLVWMVLVPIIDPILKTQRNKLFMFNEKFWWASEQDVALTFIAAQEIGSVFQSWGTDGTGIYRLFEQPSNAFKKTMQTRLWDAPTGYDHTKSSCNIFALAQFIGAKSLSYSITIDNEFGIPVHQVTGNPISGTPPAFSWATAAGVPYVWQQQGGGPYSWAQVWPDAISVLPPTAVGQVGVLTGMTITTMCDDMVLISEMLQTEIVQYRA